MVLPETETPSPLFPVDRRWLWVARVMALIPVVPVVISVAGFCVPRFGNPCYDDTRPVALLLLILIVPYLLSSLGLWVGKPKRLKKGLAWARVAGTFWSAICLLLVLGAFSVGEIASGLVGLLPAATQIVLVVSAVKTYRSLEPDEGDRGLIRRRVLLFLPYVAFLVMGAVAIPSMVLQ